jgi:hypothetical protein
MYANSTIWSVAFISYVAGDAALLLRGSVLMKVSFIYAPLLKDFLTLLVKMIIDVLGQPTFSLCVPNPSHSHFEPSR